MFCIFDIIFRYGYNLCFVIKINNFEATLQQLYSCFRSWLLLYIMYIIDSMVVRYDTFKPECPLPKTS